MSGEAFETTVTVILDGKKYQGCGKALHSCRLRCCGQNKIQRLNNKLEFLQHLLNMNVKMQLTH